MPLPNHQLLGWLALRSRLEDRLFSGSKTIITSVEERVQEHRPLSLAPSVVISVIRHIIWLVIVREVEAVVIQAVVIRNRQTSLRVISVRLCSPQVVNECNPDHFVKRDDIARGLRNGSFAIFPVIEATMTEAPAQWKVTISPLNFIEIIVDGKTTWALKDSGAQIPLISRDMFHDRTLEVLGNVTVQDVFGQPVDAPLISV